MCNIAKRPLSGGLAKPIFIHFSCNTSQFEHQISITVPYFSDWRHCVLYVTLKTWRLPFNNKTNNHTYTDTVNISSLQCILYDMICFVQLSSIKIAHILIFKTTIYDTCVVASLLVNCVLASGSFHFGRTLLNFSTQTSTDSCTVGTVTLKIVGWQQCSHFSYCPFNYLPHITVK